MHTLTGRSSVERIGNVIAFSIVILFNYLATALPLGGQTTAEVSDRYESMFTPTGFTFAIWGVIYLLLLAFVIRQFRNRASDPPSLSKIRKLFVVNCIANATWIVMWHYNHLEFSLVVMLIILGTLVKINAIIGSDSEANKGWDYFLIAVPFHVYFGWICVATIANVSILQSAYGLNDALINQQNWTLLKLIIAAAIGYFWGWRFSRAAFLLVVAWAAYGISVANAGQGIVEAASEALAICALLASLVILLRHLGVDGPSNHETTNHETASHEVI